MVCGDAYDVVQTDELRRALDRANRAAIHMLRHTWASHRIMNGIPSRIAMQRGGWEIEELAWGALGTGVFREVAAR